MFDKDAGPFSVCYVHNGMAFPGYENVPELRRAVLAARYLRDYKGLSGLGIADRNEEVAPISEFDALFND